MLQRLDIGTSRRDTTRAKTAYLEQLPLGAELGRRGWVHRALRLRVADSTADRSLVRQVLLERHYLGRWPAPPRSARSRSSRRPTRSARSSRCTR